MSALRGTLTSQQIQYISYYLNGRSTPLVPLPSSTDGLGLYGTYCSGCHDAAPGAKAGRTSAQISAAISSVSAMNTTTLRGLTTAQIDARVIASDDHGTCSPARFGATATRAAKLPTPTNAATTMH